MMEIHYSSKTNEWATPDWLYNLLNTRYQFELDPASTDDNHKCDKYYTEADDGLAQTWAGYSTFCNPPYGRELKHWVEKAYKESLSCTKPKVLLIPARPDTLYWHSYIFGKADSIYFIKGRVKFGNSKNSAPFPSAVVVYNDTQEYIGGIDIDRHRLG